MMIRLTLLRTFIWEMSMKWHLLLLGFLGGVLPLLLFLWLLTSVGLPVQSPEFIRTHTFLMPFSFLALFLGIVGIQGPVRRLYSYPISDSAIASWHMLTGISMIAAGCSLIILGLNYQFHADWPILGPTLYFAMAFAVLQPCSRIAYKTVSTIVAIPFVALILVLGFLSRYSAMKSQPKLWSEISLFEFGVLATVTLGAMILFHRSVKLDRHNLGTSDLVIDLWMKVESWIRNRLPKFGFIRSAFRDGFAAHRWLLWRQNQSLFYLNLLFAFVACVLYATTAEPEPKLVKSQFLFSGIHWFPIILSTMLALIMGIGLSSYNTDSTPSRDKVTFEEKLQSMNFLIMGSFFSTLPISNTRLSNAILLTALRGVLMSFALTLLAAGVLYLLGMDLISEIWSSGLLGLYGLVLIALPWSAVGVTATVCLIGRNKLLIAYWFSLIAGIALIGLPFTRPFTILALGLGATATNLLLVSRRNAIRKGQTGKPCATEDSRQLGLAMAIWLILLAISWQMPSLKSAASFGSAFVLLSSASVLPLIAMPLAISLNRTR